MSTYLLLTLVIDGRTHTYAIDTLSRATRYLTDGTGEGRGRSVASVSVDAGRCTLRPVGGAVLVDEHGESRNDIEIAPFGVEAAYTLSGGRAGAGAMLYLRLADAGIAAYRKVGVKRDCTLLIGRDADCALSYPSQWVSARHAELVFEGDALVVRDLESANGTFVNGRALARGASRELVPGDVVQVMDLTILAGRRFVSVNRPGRLTMDLGDVALPIEHDAFVSRAPAATPDDQLPDERPFWPAPRLMRTIHRRAFNVEEPPKAKEPDDTPALVKMGPSFLMGLSSILMAANAVSRMADGAAVLQTAPSIAMCVSMLGGMLIWPQISRRYERKKQHRDEERRRSAYSDYIAATEASFRAERDEQASILAENRVGPHECLRRVRELDPQLMSRSPLESDFMQLRVGIGELPLEADFRWPERRFTMDKDDLIDMARGLSERPPVLEGAPVACDLLSSWVCGIAGVHEARWDLVRSLVAQLATFYGFSDVKVAAVVGEEDREEWSFLMGLPHTLADDGRTRLVASDECSVRELGGYLARVLAPRAEGQAKKMVSDYGAYHVVLCADRALVDTSDVIARLEELQDNLGFSLVFLGDGIDDLPRECQSVIELGAEHAPSKLYDRSDVAGTLQEFVPDDPVIPEELEELSQSLSRLDLGGEEAVFELPPSLGFLESYEAGSVADLDVEGRWSRADSSRSLAAPIGLDSRGAVATIDPQESFDGPHGLVAGTTGSGKSELLITWILSTAVCFPPEQAAFVLIDYKGGGLADAFDRSDLRLPHLAGTVTNLDGAEVSRSLASLQAELVRRQAMLASAKRLTGDATMDVSSYQRHYAAGELAEPMPHLFVVADEFAELKAQEPEFMDELVSAARIGRSLGVHLVLATQKPTGVVSDQIQANSRFRVCLRVADAADSKEMIRRPDAAALEGPGRFILLVGYDERLALGQAAWAGVPYVPREEAEPARDLSVELCDMSGRTVDSMRPPRDEHEEGTELDAVLGELRRAAAGRAARRLWLPPLEKHPTVDVLATRYADARADDEPWELNPIVGELDDPARQEKRLLTMPLSREGNAIVYGGIGSGAEELLGSMVYSLARDHDASELNVYIIDLGSELLRRYAVLPQVGDVATTSDEEKILRLFDMLDAETERRRKELSRLGVTYTAFRGGGGDGAMPAILLVINGMAAFTELYEKLEPRLIRLVREGSRMGISTVLCASAANEVRLRLRQAFKQCVVCALANPSDYLSIFSSMRGVSVPHGARRGLVEVGKDRLTFQGAFVAEVGMEEGDVIGALAKGAQGRPAAARVRLMPARVEQGHLAPFAREGCLAIGLYEDNLEPVVLGTSETPLVRAVYSLPRAGRSFVLALCAAARAQGVAIRLADCARLLDELPGEASEETTSAEVLAGWLSQDPTQDAPLEVVVVTGISAALASLPDRRLANDASEALRAMRRSSARLIILVDGNNDVTYAREGWYMAHQSANDGIWLGNGVDSQTAIRATYGAGDKLASGIPADQGYVITTGRPRKAHYLNAAPADPLAEASA